MSWDDLIQFYYVVSINNSTGKYLRENHVSHQGNFTSSSAGGSVQKWSGVLARVKSSAHGPTKRELRIEPQSESATSALLS